ncbi:hypothetical protein [Microbacterium sp. JZ31]|uniref:hypothetical protein n=1 Tax=Microbacterium sp. JZ31 TaxID=1906274 RepID=UPI001931E47A|nr:hypothetical protein [Microbacterium sp. JZ31]
MGRHQRELALVAEANSAADQLSEKLLGRADVWRWSLPVGEPDALALRDYIVSTPEAVKRNLRQAAVSLSLYRGMRTAQGSDMANSVRRSGTPWGDRDLAVRVRERLDELNVHQLAFFASLGAAIDGLAAIAIGVSGVGIPVIRADVGSIFARPFEPTWDTSDRLRRALRQTEGTPLHDLQTKAVSGFRVGLKGAGPSGWLDWLLDQRNALVHRAPRTVFTNTVVVKGRHRFDELPPRRPEQSDIEALRRASDGGIPDFYLTEDMLTTAEGLLNSVARATVASCAVFWSAWERREVEHPDIDWRKQWREFSSDPRFEGYAPGTSVLNPKGGQLHLSPTLLRRFQNADILDTRPPA